MQIDRATINEWAKESHQKLTALALDYDFTDVMQLVAQRAAEAERAAMKPHIIKAMQDATQNMENYSYFGVNPGVHENDYEDVADAAIAARGAQGEQA